MSWVENQRDKLFESLERIEGLRTTSQSLANMMPIKMIMFAIIGLVAILIVNMVFYRSLKKTFKARKWI